MSPATACSPSSSNPSLSSCNVDFGVRRLNPRRPRVLRECLLDPTIEQILSVVRSPTAQQHARLTALVHKDFFDYCSSESHLAGYDACFFCAGPSSAGMSEESYSHVIYDMTLAAAHTLVRLNPRNSWGTRRPTTAFRRRQPQHPDASLHRSLHPPSAVSSIRGQASSLRVRPPRRCRCAARLRNGDTQNFCEIPFPPKPR